MDKRSITISLALSSALMAAAVHAVDCSRVSVSVQQLNGNHWRATAVDENGSICGTADSANRGQAVELARMECGC
jgi:hypothetical protein